MTSSQFAPPLSTLSTAEPRFVLARGRLLNVAAFAGLIAVEARPPIIGIFTLRTAVGSGLFVHPSLLKLQVTLAWALLTVAVYVYNGVSDLEADRLNGSSRPLATGRLSAKAATRTAGALALFSLACCWITGLATGVAATLSLVVGWAYSAGPKLKNTPAGVSFAIFCGAALSYFVGGSLGGISADDLVGLGTISLWICLSAAAKDFSDIAGDAAAGRKSLPVNYGPERAARLTVGVVTAVCVAALVAIWSFAPAFRLPAIILGFGTVALAVSLLNVSTAGGRGRARRPYKVFMLTQFALNAGIVLGRI